MTPPDDALERSAADLWRKENPTMSVFECDEAMKDSYRKRVASKLPSIGDNVEYRSFAGESWEAVIVGITPEGRVDIDVSIPGAKGEESRMRLTAIRWYAEGHTNAPGARPRSLAMGA